MAKKELIKLDQQFGVVVLYDKFGALLLTEKGDEAAKKSTIRIDGHVVVEDDDGRKIDTASIQVGSDTVATPGRIRVMGSNKRQTIYLDGNTGDIILSNADFAEDFTIADEHIAEAGMVMALRSDGLLQPSAEAYDTRVVGVVSGAGSFRPALVLDRQEGTENRQPIAMVGKAYCKVTAEDAPIEAGDLLTSSNLPGHAMKATDASRTSGTVIGKALRSLAAGTGLIPIVIALQ